MDEAIPTLVWVFGEGVPPQDLHWWQVGLRALTVYLTLLYGVRLGKQRFMGQASAFDLILVIILGAIAARGITGEISLFETVTALAALLGLHWLLSWLCLRWPSLDPRVKGRSHLIVSDGVMLADAMRRHHLTESDLREALRCHGCTEVAQVQCAHLERDGGISVIAKRDPPRGVDGTRGEPVGSGP
jgi:uncharacterized membrane protein YcaP (DUF421 family)